MNERIEQLRKEMADYCEPRNSEINQFVAAEWESGQYISEIADTTGYAERTIRIKLESQGIDWKSRPEPDIKPHELKLFY